MVCGRTRNWWPRPFFFNDTATTEIYTLSLHDALPIWPPVALGVPLVVVLGLTAAVGDPLSIGSSASRWIGGALAVAFVLWNGWTLWVMARNRTAILPGGATAMVVQSGPFRVSRNPLYLGLVALDVAIALLAQSFWALVFVPIGV